MEDVIVTEEQKEEYYKVFKKYVKDFIYNFQTNKEIFTADGEQFIKLKYYIDEIIRNSFILLSDEHSVEIIEYEFGIVPKHTDTLDSRKQRLIARKRGLGTTTPYVIRQICSTYVDKVDIIQHFEEYYFELRLENINKGFVNFLEDLIEIIEEIKPAHLGVIYELIETTISNLYIGSTTFGAEIITVYPWTPNNIDMKANVYISISNDYSLETIVVYPKDGGMLYHKNDD
jgi:hypothetical protein